MQIQEIKSRLSILRVLDHYGLYPDKNGMLCCPFHDDKTPSMQIYPKSNSFCCFSSNCKAGTGDQIQFIELKEAQGKHQALVIATELVGMSETIPTKSNNTPQAQDFETLFLKLKQNIHKSPKALQYLKERGLNVQRLEVGMNQNTFDQLKNCVIFPLKDKQNKIVSLYGRSILEGNSKHFYTADRKGLYPGYPDAATQSIVLTESVIDAASLLQQDNLEQNQAVLALYGTNGLSEEHIEAMSQLPQLKEIILWMDGDAAGEKATQKYQKELHELFNKAL